MFKRQYHYLIAGLADLAFDSGKGFSDMAEFREELKSILHPSDYFLVSVLFLPHDNKNLMAFLGDDTKTWDPLGNYSLQDIEEQKRITESILKENDILPSYMVTAIKNWFHPESVKDRAETEKILTEGYLKAALSSGSRFLENYTRFDRDLRNIFALINSKALGLDAVKFISGDDPFSSWLREVYKSGKDFQIPPEPEYIPVMFEIVMENEFLERERKSDIARWDFINEESFFEYFTIDWLLGYLIKLSIVIRWKQLDPEAGKTMLKKLVEEMETPVKAFDIAEE